MYLKNERLQITFADASTLNTPRFDHTAWITEVLLDGAYRFCMPEQILPNRRNSHGSGLCGEFVLGTGELAKCSEWFCKPGVGLVKQTSDYQRFNIFGTYEVQFSSVEILKKTDDTISFFQKGIFRNGYCADIKKTFHLQDNHLILDIEVSNTGTNAFELSEYQHNFIALENLPVGPGYLLELPCDKNIRQMEHATLRQGDEAPLPSAVSIQENVVHWKECMDQKILYHESCDVNVSPPHHWKLSHEQSGLSVTEEVSFRPSMVIVWGVEHCVCAELYHTVQLIPGEMAQWKRVWTFKNELKP